MMRMLKLLGVICGVFSAVGVASAGPIQWSYIATVLPNYALYPKVSAPTMLYLGSYTRESSHGSETVYAYTHVPAAPILSNPLDGNVRGRAVLIVNKNDYTLRTTPLPASQVGHYGFQVDWNITDWVSGKSSLTTLDNFEPVFQWDQSASRGELGFAWYGGSIDYAPKQQERLGGTIYNTQLHIVNTDNGTSLALDAEVTREIPGSPEPGTLLLTGFGFASVAGLRLRRRRA